MNKQKITDSVLDNKEEGSGFNLRKQQSKLDEEIEQLIVEDRLSEGMDPIDATAVLVIFTHMNAREKITL